MTGDKFNFNVSKMSRMRVHIFKCMYILIYAIYACICTYVADIMVLTHICLGHVFKIKYCGYTHIDLLTFFRKLLK